MCLKGTPNVSLLERKRVEMKVVEECYWAITQAIGLFYRD